MAVGVTLSSAVRSNLLALQNTADLLGKTQERLATGLKVNSALDDPTAFFTASSLNGRANDLSRLQDFVGNAVQTIKAADEGISAITKLVESAEATARQALQSAGNTASSTGNVDTTAGTIDDFSSELTGSVDINSTPVIVGDDGKQFTVDIGGVTTADITINTGDDADAIAVKINAALTTASAEAVATVDGGGQLVITSNNGEDITVAEGTTTGGAAATGLSTTPVVGANSAGTENGDSFSVQVGTATATTITFGTGTGEVSSIDEAVTALNAIDNVTAKITDDGFLSIEATNGEDLVITEGTNTPAADLGITAGTSTAAANTDRASFATQFNELRSQIDQLANDASYNGINLLDGDNLTVTFNEDATSSLGVSGVSFNSNGLGISSAENTFQTDGDITAALTDLNSATDTLRSQASKFGSNLSVVETRQDFTKNLINVLETGAANLTLADTNEEGANLLALQTRQQLSSTALSLASQADQNVLRLF